MTAEETNGGNRMRTVVVGGGVVGLTTAYDLSSTTLVPRKTVRQ